MLRWEPKALNPETLGVKGRRGFEPPSNVGRDKFGLEDVDAYFADLGAHSKRAREDDGLPETVPELRRSSRRRGAATDWIHTDSEGSAMDDHTGLKSVNLDGSTSVAALNMATSTPVQSSRYELPSSAMLSPIPEAPEAGEYLLQPYAEDDAPALSDGPILEQEEPEEPQPRTQAPEDGLLPSMRRWWPSQRKTMGPPSGPPSRQFKAPVAPEPALLESEASVEVEYIHDPEEHEAPRVVQVDPAMLPPVEYDSADENIVIDEEEDDLSDSNSVMSMIVEDDGAQDDGAADYVPTAEDLETDDDNDTEYVDEEEMANETTMIVPIVPERPPGLRRSTRVRVPTLDYWRGERVVYTYTGPAALSRIKAVELVEEAEPQKPRRRRRVKPNRDLAEHGEIQANLFDQSLRIFHEMTVAKTLDSLTFDTIDGNPYVKAAHLVDGPGDLPVKSSMLVIARGGHLPHRNAGNHTYMFLIWSGRVHATVNDKSFELGRATVLEVPRGNDFSLQNVGTTSVRMIMLQMTSASSNDVLPPEL